MLVLQGQFYYMIGQYHADAGPSGPSVLADRSKLYRPIHVAGRLFALHKKHGPKHLKPLITKQQPLNSAHESGHYIKDITDKTGS
jgi:hypothetical protein